MTSLGLHRRAELPGDDEAREVVEHGREIVPAPAGDLEIGEVGLPELVGRRGLVLELVGRLDDDVGRAGDEVVRLEQPIDRGLRDKVCFSSVKRTASSRGLSSGSLQRQVDDLAPDLVGDAVPDPIRLETVDPPGPQARRAGSDRTSGRTSLWECRASPGCARPADAIARPAG